MEPALIVGSSRGLGRELVRALLDEGYGPVLGVSRGDPEIAHPMYRHLSLDIASPAAGDLRPAVEALPPGPLAVIFNAACLDQDVSDDEKRVDWPVFQRVNRVGVDGWGRVLEAVEERLLAEGGCLLGVSSINALMPPVIEPRLAYGPTKAYLHMSLRCLAAFWRPRVRVVTLQLGQIQGSPGRGLPGLRKPSYEEAARHIVRRVIRAGREGEVFYPALYRITFPWIRRFLPDRAYLRLLGMLLRRR